MNPGLPNPQARRHFPRASTSLCPARISSSVNLVLQGQVGERTQKLQAGRRQCQGHIASGCSSSPPLSAKGTLVGEQESCAISAMPTHFLGLGVLANGYHFSPFISNRHCTVIKTVISHGSGRIINVLAAQRAESGRIWTLREDKPHLSLSAISVLSQPDTVLGF